MRRALLAFCLLVFAAMVAVTTWASLESNVAAGFARVAADRWGLATLFDAYFGFLWFWLWVLWKERGWVRRWLWLVLLLALGNLAIAAFVTLQAWKWRETEGFESLLAARHP
ncbi:MAG TPA: DUF1475 family protein [Holophagaceae bacterium]|nr:DUF1475 family protein [Holophagaceae bacterium]